MIKLKRTFHAVGQGAFYTERFYDDNGNNPFNVVYDCGTSSFQRELLDEIHGEFVQDTEIEYLFISHFHKDHISGIKALDRYCRVKNYVVPVLSPQMIAESALHDYLWIKTNNYGEDRFDDLFDVLEMVLGKEPIQIGEERRVFQVSVSGSGSWVYIPYNPCHNPINDILDVLDRNNCHQLAEAFRNEDFDAVTEEIRRANIMDLRLSYKDAFENHHYYVMPVYSGYANPQKNSDERICLYTGDYDASDSVKVNALKFPMGEKWDAVGTFQVPHHGSKHNSCQELYLNKDRVYVISSFGNSRYHHPHGETIGYICNNHEARLQLVGRNPDFPSYSKNFVI